MRTDTPAGGSWSSCPGALQLVALPHLPAEGEGKGRLFLRGLMGEAWKGHISSSCPGCCLDLTCLHGFLQLLSLQSCYLCPVHLSPVLGCHGLGVSLWCGALTLPGGKPLDGVENVGAGGSSAGSAAAILSPRQEPAGKGGVWEGSGSCGYKRVCWSWGAGSRLALLSLQTCSGVRGLDSSHLPRLHAGTTASELARIVLCLSFPLSDTRRT